MYKKWSRVIAAFVVETMLVGLLAGCGTSSASADASVLNICIWEGAYSQDAIDQFEKEHDCTVNVTYIDNTDTLLSKIVEGSGEYDLVDIESAYVKAFVDNGLIQKMDDSSLTNLEYVEDYLLEEGPIGDENFEYVAPASAAGYTTIVYNTETCPIEITSFSDLADPALEGEVGMVNSTISLYGAALEALGYSASSTDENEISEANDLLTEIKANVKAFVGESALSALENGEVSVALCWDYATLCTDSEDNWDTFAVADIDSDYEKFVDYWGITSTCTNTDLAMEFINWMISPEAVAMHVESEMQLPMVSREYIEDLLPEGYYANPAIAKYEELSEKSWLIAVEDEQISLMDTYYTLLMGGN